MRGTTKASVNLYRHVETLARMGLDFDVCVMELVDNAIDAMARNIDVEAQQGRRLRIRDNGDGVPDLGALVCFGGHVGHTSAGKKNGIYGAGLKDAALGLGGERSRVSVKTVRKDDRLRFDASIDWQRLRDSDECMEWEDAPAPDDPSGTTITIEPLRMKVPEGERRSKLIEKLGYVYSPALKDGVVIRFTLGGKTHELTRWQLPKLQEHIDERIAIGNKRARLYAGIVAHGERNDRAGLTYCHATRVIKRAGRSGCGEWSVSRICGFVEIEEGWDRTRNKTDLVDADDLYEEVERRLTPMLRKAAEESHSIEFRGAWSQLETLLSDALLGPKDEKAKRGTGDKSGTQEPKNTGRGHKNAQNRQPGDRLRRRSVTRVKLDFQPGYADGEVFGEWEISGTSKARVATVTLYNDHPFVARAMKPWNADALFIAAMSVVAVSKDSDSGEQLGFVPARQVLVSLASLSRLSVSVDGLSLQEAAE